MEPVGCVCGGAWAEGSRAVCSLASPALSGPMSLLSPGGAAGLTQPLAMGVALHGCLSLFCSVKPSALGIYSPRVRLQTPFPHHPPPPPASQPRSRTDARVQLGKSHRTPGLIKAPLLHTPYACSRRDTFPPRQPSSAWPRGAEHGDPKPSPSPCPAAIAHGPGQGSSPALLCVGFVLLSLRSER